MEYEIEAEFMHEFLRNRSKNSLIHPLSLLVTMPMFYTYIETIKSVSQVIYF